MFDIYIYVYIYICIDTYHSIYVYILQCTCDGDSSRYQDSINTAEITHQNGFIAGQCIPLAYYISIYPTYKWIVGEYNSATIPNHTMGKIQKRNVTNGLLTRMWGYPNLSFVILSQDQFPKFTTVLEHMHC